MAVTVVTPAYQFVHRAQGSAIAEEAIERIARLYGVEKRTRGQPPDVRVRIRQAEAVPMFEELGNWLHAQLPKLSGKTPLAAAIRYGLTRLPRLSPYLANGHLEIDNNIAEQAIRGIALGRKNYLLVDESIRPDYIDWTVGNKFTPRLASLRDQISNFGQAVSAVIAAVFPMP